MGLAFSEGVHDVMTEFTAHFNTESELLGH